MWTILCQKKWVLAIVWFICQDRKYKAKVSACNVDGVYDDDDGDGDDDSDDDSDGDDDGDDKRVTPGITWACLRSAWLHRAIDAGNSYTGANRSL